MVLVCGGAGYIGSHMVKRLRQAGIPHLVLDNLRKGHRAAVGASEFVEADLREPASLEALAGRPINCVMHFAASIEVGESVADPSGYYQNNVVAAWNLLEWARAAGVQRVIFSSTAAVYGEPQVVPIPESHPKSPTSPYGDTKWAVERMLEAYDRAYGVRSVRLRYFNAAGADPEGELGEDHDPETHIIPRVALAALGRGPGLKVFGSDYPTPDGTCVRDYVHVNDLADAHLLAYRHLAGGGGSVAYNLGHGTGFSVLDVVGAVESVHGAPIPFELADRRPGDPAFLVADSQAIRRDWGWTPRWTEVADMVSHAYGWLKAHPRGYG